MSGLAPPLAAIAHYFFGILMFITALFLILPILVQRGRGGGLAGAFGGMGGQSAFGTKAGDLFTRITMGVATFWIILCVAAIAFLNQRTSVFGPAVTTGSSPLGTPGTEASGPVTPLESGAGLPPSSGPVTPAESGAGLPPSSGGEAATASPPAVPSSAAPSSPPPSAAETPQTE
jgi:preprotein translocase subunit SecG